MTNCSYATDRQEQVLNLISHGYTREQIARRMHISSSTVKSMLNRINRRLGAGTTPQAVRRGFETGVLIANASPDVIGLRAENQALLAELGRVYRALVEANRRLRVQDEVSSPHSFSQYLHGLREVA